MSTASVALSTIRSAAQKNNATNTLLPLSVYAGVTALRSDYQYAYNSALDSAAIAGARVTTTAQLQALVDAYNTILASTEGYGGAPIPLPSAALFAAVGVTCLSGSSDLGTAVRLLDDSLFGAGRAAADTVAELQARADAANHVIAAVGGSAAEAKAKALTAQDMAALGVTGVTAENLGALQTVLQAITNDFEVATKYGVQTVVNATLRHDYYSAFGMIGLEASLNSANTTTLSACVYATAGVQGVSSDNLASINSALNSDALDGLLVTLSGELQKVVDAYSAILQSAHGAAGNTIANPTGAQYAAVGVTGISGTPTEGSALHLLDSVVDASTQAKVDTVSELQAIAQAANHLMAAVGGTSTDAAALTYNDFLALGINSGQRGGIIEDVRTQLQTETRDAVDTQAEVQALVNKVIAHQNATGVPVIIIDDRLLGVVSDLHFVNPPVLLA